MSSSTAARAPLHATPAHTAPTPPPPPSGAWRTGAAVPHGRDTLVGVAAALLAVAVWGGALSITRLGVADEAALGTHDIAVLRFLAPALALMPVLLRQGLPPLRHAGAGVTLVLLVGGGAPFVLLVAAGLRLAPAADAGALLPGAMPLFVALLSAALLGERLGRLRLAGLGLVSAAVALVALPAVVDGGAEDGFEGHALLLAAAAVSAGYTVALRRSGLGAWHATALVSAGSLLGFGPVYLLALEPQVLEAPLREVALQALCQGALSGLVAPIAFATAIARLGATRAAAFGGLTPVVAALAGLLLLGEVPDGPTMIAVALAGLGVLLVSWGR